MPLRLHSIIVSTRPTRVGPVFGEWFHRTATAHGAFEAHLIDLEDFNLPIFDEMEHPRTQNYKHAHTKRWSDSVSDADAFVFITPEYNFGMPPSFLNALSYLAVEWNYKPAGFVSYGGISGGLRSAQMGKQMLTTLKVMPIPEAVAIPNYRQHLDENYRFEPTDLMIQGANTMLGELHRWAEALQSLRS